MFKPGDRVKLVVPFPRGPYSTPMFFIVDKNLEVQHPDPDLCDEMGHVRKLSLGSLWGYGNRFELAPPLVRREKTIVNLP